MGCKMCKKKADGEDKKAKKKSYSWDKREKLDAKNFICENVKTGSVGRLPGQVDGQQFIIQNCQDSNIYVFDNSATVTVDDCKNCRIFLGPVKSSVFVRDCKECRLVVACQQFRTRDCQKLDVFLHCITQPIIESSSGVRVGCYQYHYEELEEQFKKAELSLFNNNWSNIHDFTPVAGERNWSLMPKDSKVEDSVPLPKGDQFKGVKLSTHPKDSLVPLTLGSRARPSDESCLVVFFSDGQHVERAQNYIDEMTLSKPHCHLVRTKQISMEEADCERVLQTDAYTSMVSKGTVIGLEYCGQNVVSECKQSVVAIATGATGLVYVSNQHADSFFTFADMQLSAGS